MQRLKTFFIYAILVVAFFLFSQIMIFFAIHTTYHEKSYTIKADIPIQVEVKATSVNGQVTGNLINSTDKTIKNEYIKLEFYSKHDVLMGTKYIEITQLKPGEKLDFERKFNYNKVDKVVLDVVEDMNEEITEEQKVSDPTMNFAMLISSIILLCYFG